MHDLISMMHTQMVCVWLVGKFKPSSHFCIYNL